MFGHLAGDRRAVETEAIRRNRGYLNVPNKGYESWFEMRMEQLPTGEWAQVPRLTPRGAGLFGELLVRKGRVSPKVLGYEPRSALPGETDDDWPMQDAV